MASTSAVAWVGTSGRSGWEATSPPPCWRAAATARSGSWPTPGRRPALLERLRRGRWAVGEPAPTATFDESGWSVALHGAVGATLQGALGLTAADTYGARRDAPAGGGRSTCAARTTRRHGDALRDTGGGVSGSRDEEYAVTVDPTAARSASASASRQPPRGLGGPARARPAAAGLLSVPTRGDRAWVTETHLDLTDPANAATAGAFLAQGALAAPASGTGGRHLEQLARRLERNGVVHARTYALVGKTSGFDVRGGAGPVRGGLTWSTAETGARLLAAATRGRDGTWVRRGDCEQRA